MRDPSTIGAFDRVLRAATAVGRAHSEPDRLNDLGPNFITGLAGSDEKVTNKRMRDILFPTLLKTPVLSRDQLKKAFMDFNPGFDESKVGIYLTLVSSQLGMTKNDFLRQVVAYEYPRHHWEKDNFALRGEFRGLLSEVLQELKGK